MITLQLKDDDSVALRLMIQLKRVKDKIDDKIEDKIGEKIDDKIVAIGEISLDPAGMSMLCLISQP